MSSTRRKVLVIADEETCMMYRMVGCETISVSDPDELISALKASLTRDDLAVILVSQELGEPVREEIEKAIATSKSIISYLPTPRSEGKPVDMRRLLLRALGVG